MQHVVASHSGWMGWAVKVERMCGTQAPIVCRLIFSFAFLAFVLHFLFFFYFLFSFCFEERKSLLFCQGQHKQSALRLFNEMSFNLKVFIVADKSSTLILVLICLFLTRFNLMKRKNPTFRISSSVAGGEWGIWKLDQFEVDHFSNWSVFKVRSQANIKNSLSKVVLNRSPRFPLQPTFAKHQGAFWWWLLATFYAKYEWMSFAGKCAYVCEYPSG